MTSVSIGAYIPIIYLTSSFNIYQYAFFNGIVWTLGLIASIVWYVKGYETGKGISIEEIEG
ncbi:hypothetical protein [Saccharolobus shibatae]|uniref:Uncharacterized protein n=1 Tax=Saccharolobus shibatae TaxID=2286 RepID=A0A8F5BW91_9CREN|nr:hypothetical protein [Saccharolobus shibatae]QXJ32456.1 hypothetical protein J5U21_02107 [Saccharolobus shibatae]